MSPLRLVALACGLGLLVWACGPAGESGPAQQAGKSAASPSDELPKVSNPRIAPAGEMAALYLTLELPPDRIDRLLRVESPAIGPVELHETVLDGDVVRMKARPDGLEIQGGRLELAPGGAHGMLMGARLDGSAPVPVILHFEHAGTLELEVPVEAVGAAGHAHHVEPAAQPMDHGDHGHGAAEEGQHDHGASDHGGGGKGADDPGGGAAG